MQTVPNITACILRLPEVKRRTGLSRSTIYERIETGNFPLPIGLGGRSVGWLESEIESWIAARVEVRRTPAKAKQ
jgi:prophage regulatory protein